MTLQKENHIFQGDGIDRKTRNTILDDAGLQIVGTERIQQAPALLLAIYMASSTIMLFQYREDPGKSSA